MRVCLLGVRVRRLVGACGGVLGLCSVLSDDVDDGVCDFVVFEDHGKVEEFFCCEVSFAVFDFADDGLVPGITELVVHAVCEVAL